MDAPESIRARLALEWECRPVLKLRGPHEIRTKRGRPPTFRTQMRKEVGVVILIGPSADPQLLVGRGTAGVRLSSGGADIGRPKESSDLALDESHDCLRRGCPQRDDPGFVPFSGAVAIVEMFGDLCPGRAAGGGADVADPPCAVANDLHSVALAPGNAINELRPRPGGVAARRQPARPQPGTYRGALAGLGKLDVEYLRAVDD